MRQQYIDILKGITIIWVLWMHMDMPELIFPSVQMPIFFFLSGTFYRAKGNFITQLKDDFFRLLVPVFFFMAIAACLMMIRGDNIWSWNLINVMQTLRNGSITWFLIALFGYRMINYPFEYRKHKILFLVLFVFLYPIGFLWKVFMPEFEFPIIPLQEMMMFGIYYTIGYIVGKQVLERTSFFKWGGICCLVYIVFVHIVDWQNGMFRQIPYFIYGFFYTLCCIYLGLIVCRQIEKVDFLSRPLSYVGKNSIVFYLTHWPIWIFLFKPLWWNLYMVFVLIVLIEFPLIFILTKNLPCMFGYKRLPSRESVYK